MREVIECWWYCQGQLIREYSSSCYTRRRLLKKVLQALSLFFALVLSHSTPFFAHPHPPRAWNGLLVTLTCVHWNQMLGWCLDWLVQGEIIFCVPSEMIKQWRTFIHNTMTTETPSCWQTKTHGGTRPYHVACVVHKELGLLVLFVIMEMSHFPCSLPTSLVYIYKNTGTGIYLFMYTLLTVKMVLL